jgi:hypothetical protein
MKKFILFLLGILVSLPFMVGIAWLRQFIFEPDYIHYNPGYVIRNNRANKAK